MLANQNGSHALCWHFVMTSVHDRVGSSEITPWLAGVVTLDLHQALCNLPNPPAILHALDLTGLFLDYQLSASPYAFSVCFSSLY